MTAKTKKQKVRFHKGDKRPGGAALKEKDLYYTKKMIKRGRKIVWHCIDLSIASRSDAIIDRYNTIHADNPS